MNFRFFGLLLGAGTLLYIAVPVFATSVPPTRAAQPVGPVGQLATRGPGLPRSGPVGRRRSPLAAPTPAGCTSNGKPYFVGLSGSLTGEMNYAGGGDAQGFAGVVAGWANEACDGWSGILAGSGNVIGGSSYEDSEDSSIGGGDGNGMLASPDGFIGAGSFNLISYGPFALRSGLFQNTESSGIVSGQFNSITSSNSVIGGGTQNVVALLATTTDKPYGLSAFVGAGTGNSVTGNASGIVSGYANSVSSDFSTVVGGQSNKIDSSSNGSSVNPDSAIVGGVSNTIATTETTAGMNGQSAFIGAGSGNTVTAPLASIVGGFDNSVVGSGSTIGGGSYNSISATSDLALVGAGQDNSVSGGLVYGSGGSSAVVVGYKNSITSPLSFIGGGYRNIVAPVAITTYNAQGQSAFVGAGSGNVVQGNFSGIVSGFGNAVSSDNSTVVGGQFNTVVGSQSGSSVGAASVIAGGIYNAIYPPTIAAKGQSAFIGAGYENTVTANFASIVGGLANSTLGLESAIGGGSYNSIVAPGLYGAIAGGHKNAVSAAFAAVGGGYKNKATGQASTIPGGNSNTAAGVGSFAAGTASNAATDGAFVWSDDASDAKTVTAKVANEFLARAVGGFYLYSAANLSTGVKLAPGSGSWSSLSDRATKTAIVSVNDEWILTKVASLPVSEWSYTAQGTGVRHLGPMAQDFRAAFGLGEDEKHISTVDEEGVALAAIKALQVEVSAKNRQIAGQQGQITELQGRFASLEKRLEILERTRRPRTPRGGF